MSVRRPGTGRVSLPPRHGSRQSAAPAPSASVCRSGTVLVRVSPPVPQAWQLALLSTGAAPALCASLRRPERPC